MAFVALVLFALALFHSLASGLNPADEAYFLHVVNRVLSGELLYRDVEFPATPLSVYAAAGLTAALGREVLVIKLAAAALHAATALVWLRVDRRLGGAERPPLVLLAALALAHPSPEALYTPLAMMLLAVSVSAALDTPDRGISAAALAGAAAGLSFAAKQNVGLLALAAVLALMWRTVGGAERRAVLGAFGAAGLAPLLPSFAAGAGAGLMDYGFSTKVEYLRAARIGLAETAHDVVGRLATARGFRSVGEAAWDAWTLLPAVAVVFVAAGVAVTARRRQEPPSPRGDAVAAVVILAVAVGAVYPRMDTAHLAHAVPGSVVAIAWAARAMRGRHARLGLGLQRALAGGTLATAVLALAAGALRLSSPDFALSSRPGLRGVRVPVSVESDLVRLRAALVAEPPAAWFHLSPRAGLYYLVTGGRDPTPFDYPVVSALGRDAVAVLAGKLRHDASGVCVDERRLAALRPARVRPTELEQWVRTHLDRGPDLGACTVYTPVASRAGAGRGVIAGIGPGRD